MKRLLPAITMLLAAIAISGGAQPAALPESLSYADRLLMAGKCIELGDNAGFSADDSAAAVVLSYYDKAVELCPESYRTWLARAIYLDCVEEEFARSNADYRKAIELAPQEIEPYTRYARSLAACQNNVDSAIAVYRQCAVNVKEYPYNHNDLAKLLILKGCYDEADEVMRQALVMTGNNLLDASALDFIPIEITHR